MLEQSIIDLLTSNETISGIVGTKIFFYPTSSETVKAPYISLKLLSKSREYTTEYIVDICEAIIQVNCWATNYYNSIALEQAVLVAMDNHTEYEEDNPSDNPSLVSDVEIIRITLEPSGGDISDLTAGTDIKKYGRSLRFRIQYFIDA